MDDRVYIHHFLHWTGRGDIAEVAENASNPADFFVDGPQVRCRWVVLPAPFLDDVHSGLNDSQRIIDFVRRPGHPLTYRGQSFALHELLLRLVQAAIGLLEAR